MDKTSSVLTVHRREKAISPGGAAAFFSAVLLGLAAYTGSAVYCRIALLLVPLGIVSPITIIPALAATSLSGSMFTAFEGIGLTRILSLTLTAGVALDMLRTKRSIDKEWLWFFPAIAAALLITSAVNNAWSQSSTFVIALNLLLALSFANLRAGKAETGKLLYRICAVFLAVTLAMFLKSCTEIAATGLQGRLSVDSDTNLNRQAMMCAQMGAFLLAEALLAKKPAVKLICAAGFLMNLFNSLVSGSRTGCIALVFGAALSSLILLRRKKDKAGAVIIIPAAFAAAAMFYLISANDSILKARFTLSSVLSSGGTYRWENITAELKYVIPRHPLFGVGASAEYETAALLYYSSNPASSHNILFSMLAQVGFIGSACYTAFFASLVKKLLSGVKRNAVLAIPLFMLLTALINGVGEVVYNERMFWFALSLAILCLRVFGEKPQAPLKNEGRSCLCRKYR